MTRQDRSQQNSVPISGARRCARAEWRRMGPGGPGTTRPPPPHARRRLMASAALLAAICGWGGPARAEFTVCNQTLDVVNLAVGQEVDSLFQTDGWWTVGANQCADVIRDELANRFIYVYATDVFGHPVLSGKTEMCVDIRRFTIRGIDDCWLRGHLGAPFLEVDTQRQARWTLFLSGRSP